MTKSVDQSSKEKLKVIFDNSTKKGQKATLTLVCFAALSVGFFVGRYVNTDIRGNVATYNGGKVTKNDYYQSLKNNTNGSGLLRSTLIMSIFDKEYGSKISEKEVNEALPYYGSGAGENNQSQQKELTRQQLAFEYGIKQQLNASDEEMEKVFPSYKVPVDIQFMVFTDETKANEAADKLKLGAVATELAKEYQSQIGNGETVTYTNAVNYNYQNITNVFDSSIVEQIYQMQNKEVKVIHYGAVQSNGTTTNFYYVIKMIKTNKNSGNWEDYKKDLKKLVQLEKLNSNSKEVIQIVNKTFKKSNVQVEDDYLKKALADYID